MTSPWTDERVARLTELWDAGTSASLIGKALGMSKNAVVGKAFRLKLLKRDSPIVRHSIAGERGDTVPRRKIALPPQTVPSKAVVPPEPPESEASVAPQRRPCQFIEGEKGRDFTLYADVPRCPAAAQPGSSYCAEHHQRCRAQRQPSEAA